MCTCSNQYVLQDEITRLDSRFDYLEKSKQEARDLGLVRSFGDHVRRERLARTLGKLTFLTILVANFKSSII